MYKERIKLGEVKLVREDSQMPLTMDGSASPIRMDDGSLKYIITDVGNKPFYRIYKGNEYDPFVEFDREFSWDFNGYPEKWPCGIWAQSVYVCDDGMLIGFCHREDLDRQDPAYLTNYHIGLGVSFDGGDNWFYAGDICGTECNYMPPYHANMGGCPTVLRDGYFYTYYNEFTKDKSKFISAARFSVDETIKALKNKKLPRVYKYNGEGRWDVDGMSGSGAPIIRESPFGKKTGGYDLVIDSHSRAAYVDELCCYVMTFQTGGDGKLLMYFSSDCEHWDEYMSVADIEGEDKALYMQPYSTFVDLSGRSKDSLILYGDRFMLHFLKKGMADLYGYDEYYAREIIITK